MFLLQLRLIGVLVAFKAFHNRELRQIVDSKQNQSPAIWLNENGWFRGKIRKK